MALGGAAGKRLAEAFVRIRVDRSMLIKGLNVAKNTVTSAIESISSAGSSLLLKPFQLIFDAITKIGRSIINLILSPLKLLQNQLVLLAGGAGFGLLVGKAVATFANFEQEMLNVKAVMIPTAREFERLEQLARQLGASTEFTAGQIAATEAELARAGLTVNEIFGVMNSVVDMATIAQIGLAEAAGITVGIMKSLEIGTEDAVKVIDTLTRASQTSRTTLDELGTAFSFVGPVAFQAGQSLEDITAAIQVLADKSIPASTAGTGLSRVLAALVTSKTQKAFQKFGVDTVDRVTGNVRRLSDIVRDLGNEFDRRGTIPAERLNFAMEQFGQRGGRVFAAVVQEGADSLNRFSKSNKNSSDTSRRAATTIRSSLINQLKELVSAISDVAITFASSFQQSLKGLTDELVKMSNTMAKLAPEIGEIGNVMLKNAIESVKVFTQWISRNTVMLRQWALSIATISNNVQRLIGLFTRFVSGIVGGALSGAITRLLDALEIFTDPAVVSAGILELRRKLFSLFGSLINKAKPFIEFIMDGIRRIVQAVKLLTFTIQNIGALTSTRASVRQEAQNLVAIYADALDQTRVAQGKLFERHLQSIGTFFTRGGFVKFSSLALEKGLAKQRQEVRRFFDSMKRDAQSVKELFGEGAVADLFPKTKQLFGTLMEMGKKLGKSVGKGFTDGAVDGVAAVTGAAKGTGGGQISDIVSFLNSLQAAAFDKDKLGGIEDNTDKAANELANNVVPALNQIAENTAIPSTALFG